MIPIIRSACRSMASWRANGWIASSPRSRSVQLRPRVVRQPAWSIHISRAHQLDADIEANSRIPGCSWPLIWPLMKSRAEAKPPVPLPPCLFCRHPRGNLERYRPGMAAVMPCLRAGQALIGGAGGIRTLDRALQPYNGLANRRLQPLGHSSIRADMPDTGASRKRQIRSRGDH
jgi:hypothetical protein